MTVELPSAYAALPEDEAYKQYAHDLLEFLSSPLVDSIFNHHPNWVVANGPRPEWDDWWHWAAEEPDQWKEIVDGSDAHESIRRLLAGVQRLALPRESGDRPMDPLLDGNGVLPVGMSPKKAHEVRRMSALVGEIIRENGRSTHRCVDVGAGQGYLSRALSSGPHALDVLALDSSEVQTHGARVQESKVAKRRGKRKKNSGEDPADPEVPPGTLVHRLIKVDFQSLSDAVSDWLATLNDGTKFTSTAVHMVALHACGGLTPETLRRFIAQAKAYTEVPAGQLMWYPSGLTVVGCCYHLIDLERDFPLSSVMKDLNSTFDLQLCLQHLHLAAQCPAHWRSSPEAWENTQLALKKIVYRALLVRLLPDDFQPHRDGMPSAPRLGRLNDSAYDSWGSFLAAAAPRMGFDKGDLPDSVETGELALLARRIEVLHILRCVLGPVVESLILLDRYLFLRQHLPHFQVDLVPLFDQATGSARNMALVVR
ncbi:hypothetical protein AURDEDRAFT_182479 [Auricularia subglabra TFB-10046 SS5]|nr:hypothetical protein AURDEDRAFT_182479 [Auricularia subglabra TFB-10046 SS5]